jgi:anaphase-promoting complex subunit 1
MAAVSSLGVHTPVGLAHLITEGILPQDPSTALYQWELYTSEIGGEEVEEEIVATRSAVVWSQGQFVRNTYRFDLEGEDVIQAVLTTFPAASKPNLQDGRISGTDRTPRKRLRLSTASRDDDHKPAARPIAERALVVLFKSKAHIHFLHGANHIVNLPFEVEKAFPAPRGLVLQRKATDQLSLPPTPRLPSAPPNSFLFPSLRTSQSYLQSPISLKAFASNKPTQPSPLGGDTKLEALFQSLTAGSQKEAEEDVTNIYSLSSPLADLGVVTYSLQQHRPVRSGKSRTSLNVDFEGLEPAEKVIYVSARDELHRHSRRSGGPLILLVTFNAGINAVSVWHAWYIEEKSLRTLLKLRTEQKAAKARRRSSFLSASAATGSATPAVRRREGPRESFAAAGAMLQHDTAAVPGEATSRRPTREEEEQMMAAQMDPDYKVAGSQQPVRESNRRISSINADVRASQTTVGASFAGTAGRRHTSFGGHQAGRRSLNHRKSRGSTPGNVFSQSLGPDDDTMDLDSTIEFDPEESLDGVLRHIRNTYEVSGLDTVFGSAEEGFKRDLVLRKIHAFTVGSRASLRSDTGPTVNNFSVATLSEPTSINGPDDPRIRLFLHDRQSNDVQYVALKVKHCALYPESAGSPIIAIPVLTGESRLDPCDDMVQVNDGSLQAIMFGSRGVQFSLDEQLPCPLLFDAPYRAYNVLDFAHRAEHMKDVGRNRTLPPPQSPLRLCNVGTRGTFDVLGTDGIHQRRKLCLRPHDSQLDQLLTLCELMLSKQQARLVRKTWCMAYAWLKQHPESLVGTDCSKEYVAFVATLFTFVFGMLDSKARAAINLAKVAASKVTTGSSVAVGVDLDRHSHLATSSAWSWLPSARPVAHPLSQRSKEKRKDQLIITAAVIADEMVSSGAPNARHPNLSVSTAMKFMLGLHIFREEHALDTLASAQAMSAQLVPIIAQLGCWLGLDDWSFAAGRYYNLAGASEEAWAFVKSKPSRMTHMTLLEQPTSAYQWFEHALQQGSSARYPSLFKVAQLEADQVVPKVSERTADGLTPRLIGLSNLLASTDGLTASPTRTVELLADHHFTVETLETLPESLAAPFMEAIVRCEKEPPTTWRSELLRMVGRADLVVGVHKDATLPHRSLATSVTGTRDVHAVCSVVDHAVVHAKTKEAGRHAISQLIFSEDRRLVEAASLMHFNTVQQGWCPRHAVWDEQRHFDEQRKIMQLVTTRMIALPAGNGMIHYDSQMPLLTERYHLAGFNSSCLMQPMGHTLTAERGGLTEEKVNWAYFHAGVSAGLRISKNVKGIDTSWVAFNKPGDLTNRHAGLLLALGLSGHLRHLAKWLSFKYLTPKHTMTSVGLLLGLSASHIGTMDALITKMLSVHITKMLPPGAADVNVSPATQTAGLMGIGLLYYNTQHRRMSEIMLSEIEYMEIEDPDSGPDPLRDESYRLAAGFALGFINLGKGNYVRGLHGMQLPERLLAMAVGPRPINAVHVFDRATAGAVMALALVYMKSGDQSIARKIDIPDTETQFDHVRPDILMLRAMAKHMILWDEIQVRTDLMPGQTQSPDQATYTFEKGWIGANLPSCYASDPAVGSDGLHKSERIPRYNVLAGLAWALGLKYAGSGNLHARDEILSLLKYLSPRFFQSLGFWFDAKIARASLGRCLGVVAVAAAVVMAGTGDLEVFRYLRRFHGRVEAEIPYGSHMASHMAIGILFLAGGTFTFGTSDLAIAALMVALHPIWPTEVNDNRVHLQAFRHLWVLAAEARCIVVEDIDTQRPVHMPLKVTLKSGEVKSVRAPCLLPELDSVATVQTDDPAYWRVTLDFVGNPTHLQCFRQDQHISVRRCPAAEAHESPFSATLAALTDMSLTSTATRGGHGSHGSGSSQAPWLNVLALPAFSGLDRADVELLLPAETQSSVYTGERTTVMDDRLVLKNGLSSMKLDELWNLRTLFAWAERETVRRGIEADDGTEDGFKWLGKEAIQELRAGIEDRGKRR